MKFNYVEITPQVARPLIAIKVSYKDKFLITEALVDSGADYCVFPLEVAPVLGIPIEKAKRTHLTGFLEGSTNLFLYPVKLAIDNHTVEVLAGFAQGMSMYAPCTLGQQGFFDNFKICFDKSRLQLNIDPK